MRIDERTLDPAQAQRTALDGRATRIWTAMPGIIQSFNAQAMTCEVQIAVQATVTRLLDPTSRSPTESTNYENFPKLVDCPVVFPSGGGCTLTFPLQQGDECLVVFGARGIDFWWQNGGAKGPQPPAESRMHDLSDGFVIPGPFSQPRVLANVSTVGAELRSTDGSVSILLNPSGAITMKAPNGVTVQGSLTVTGDVIGDTGSHSVSLGHHVHTGVQSGPSDTGPPA